MDGKDRSNCDSLGITSFKGDDFVLAVRKDERPIRPALLIAEETPVDAMAFTSWSLPSVSEIVLNLSKPYLVLGLTYCEASTCASMKYTLEYGHPPCSESLEVGVRKCLLAIDGSRGRIH